MDAIELVLRALEIGDGDEVITTPMTAFATTLAIMRAGAIPVLADIEPDSGLLAIESARRCVSPRTRAIVLVPRSEEHTSELQSLMRISYAVFCLKKKNQHNTPHII